MRKVWVTGANGQVGGALDALVAQHRPQGWRFWFTDRAEVDITDQAAVDAFMERHGIDTVVNCAAYTAVDAAESDEEEAFRVNRDATAYLAQAAKTYDAWLIHLSTDYVFGGGGICRPWREEDPTDPQGVYARSKYEGELAIKRIAPAHALIIRTSWVYSDTGRNFVRTMLRLGKERDRIGVVCDQIGTPTYAHDIAAMLMHLLRQGTDALSFEPKVLHFSNEGCASWYDFAIAVFELAKIDCRVEPIATEAYPTPAKRPYYSVLDKRSLKGLYGIEIAHWRDALKRCIETMRDQGSL